MWFSRISIIKFFFIFYRVAGSNSSLIVSPVNAVLCKV